MSAPRAAEGGRAPDLGAERGDEGSDETPAHRQYQAGCREEQRRERRHQETREHGLNPALAPLIVAAVRPHRRDADDARQRDEGNGQNRAADGEGIVRVPAHTLDLVRVGAAGAIDTRVSCGIERRPEVLVEREGPAREQMLTEQHRVLGVSDGAHRRGEEDRERQHEHGRGEQGIATLTPREQRSRPHRRPSAPGRFTSKG